MSLEKTVGAEIKKSADKAGKIRKALLVQPVIKKTTAKENLQYSISLYEPFCFHIREKIGNQHIRAHKSIVGKGKEIGSAAKSGEVRKQAACCIKILSHIISNGYMLGIPVCLGAKPGTGRYQKQDENAASCQKKQQSNGVSPGEFLRLAVEKHNNSFLLLSLKTATNVKFKL